MDRGQNRLEHLFTILRLEVARVSPAAQPVASKGILPWWGCQQACPCILRWHLEVEGR